MAKTEQRARRPRAPERRSKRPFAAAEDKKAEIIVVLDLRKAAGFTDYFVICSGSNARQIRAIADALIEALAADGAKPAHVEGYDRRNGSCSTTSTSSCTSSRRRRATFYGLERLWGNAEPARRSRRAPG